MQEVGSSEFQDKKFLESIDFIFPGETHTQKQEEVASAHPAQRHTHLLFKAGQQCVHCFQAAHGQRVRVCKLRDAPALLGSLHHGGSERR
jgi:hypothetical protein